MHQPELFSFEIDVDPAWIDYNGHMNIAYYVLAFDKATDHMFDLLGLGAAYVAAQKASIFAVEAHVTYDREVVSGDPLLIRTQLLGCDAKRIHFFHQMYHAHEGYLSATNEIMGLHVDTAARRAVPFPAERAVVVEAAVQKHAALPQPPAAGRRISLTR